MKWEFKATDLYDAGFTVQKWIVGGILPNNVSFRIYENDDRPGYFIAEQV